MKCPRPPDRLRIGMQTVILAGGLGSRLSEETQLKPKALVEVGDHPILWHLLKYYQHHDFNEFVLALGYKGDLIKEYFLSYFELNNDISVNLADGSRKVHKKLEENWKVHLFNTGLHTQTGGRIKRLADKLDSTFMLTYCDGLANVDLKALVDFHKSHGKLATVTAVRPPARFGGFVFDGDRVAQFTEKPQTGEGWINGGFFVLEPGIIEYIGDDTSIWEREPLERLARDGQLMAFKHDDFFQPMDTLREKRYLDELWRKNESPWRLWT